MVGNGVPGRQKPIWGKTVGLSKVLEWKLQGIPGSPNEANACCLVCLPSEVIFHSKPVLCCVENVRTTISEAVWLGNEILYLDYVVTPPKTKLPLKNGGWKTTFPLKMVPFRGHSLVFSGFSVANNQKYLVRFGFGRMAVKPPSWEHFYSFRWCPNGREKLGVPEITFV